MSQPEMRVAAVALLAQHHVRRRVLVSAPLPASLPAVEAPVPCGWIGWLRALWQRLADRYHLTHWTDA